MNVYEYAAASTLALAISLAYSWSVSKERTCYWRTLGRIEDDEERAAKGKERKCATRVWVDAALRCQCEPTDEKYLKYLRNR